MKGLILFLHEFCPSFFRRDQKSVDSMRKMFEASNSDIVLECFDFVDDLRVLIASSDFVIGHAGMGTIVETLGANKPLLIVVNEGLQSNHQMEIARHLASLGCLQWTKCDDMKETLESLDILRYPQNPLPPADVVRFFDFIETILAESD
jgi:beta-1,4-N-acetylglucosaminyltransferase